MDTDRLAIIEETNTPDEIAECWEGVPTWFYNRLWKIHKMVHWTSFLTENEKKLLLELDKENEELGLDPAELKYYEELEKELESKAHKHKTGTQYEVLVGGKHYAYCHRSEILEVTDRAREDAIGRVVVQRNPNYLVPETMEEETR